MEQKKRKNRKRKLVFLVLLLILLQAELYYNYLFVCPILRRIIFTNVEQQFTTSPPPCTMVIRGRHVVMDNGLVRVTLSVPSGMITEINYNGGSNTLDVRQKEMQRGYWDLVWSSPGQLHETFLKLRSTSFDVVVEDENQIELSFKNAYDPSFDFNATHLPLNVDKRFVLLRGESGFYSYAIFERLEGWPALHIVQTRLTFKLNERFNYMAISDDKQRFMPNADDLRRGQRLPYIEATLLTNTSNPALKGEVDDKYQYSLSNRENQVHGWVSSHERTSGLGCKCSGTHQGLWIVMPSNEFKSGGPMKQELTSHAGPTCLADFHSRHYAGKTFEGLKFEAGEAWKKVLGPVFIYLNNNESENTKPYYLWEDAKKQAVKEIQKWPYDFPMSSDFPRAHQRSKVKGRLLIKDRFLKMENFPAKFGYVGLAAPGSPGSWQMEAKEYQFWVQTDNDGYFTMKNVRPGHYNLYAWIPGIFGDYKYDVNIHIKSGNLLKMGDLIFEPPRNGPTIWEVGIPDRTAAEFYVPDPIPELVNSLYLNHSQRYRQYGLWDRYTDLYPNHDLIYKVGSSNYAKDWFFAHVNRRIQNNTYVATTWQIHFVMEEVVPDATYTIQMALASVSMAELQVRVNDDSSVAPYFVEELNGKDNAIARHGIHGMYKVISVDISGSKLLLGANIIFLKQANAGSPSKGIMYDYLRFEGPVQ